MYNKILNIEKINKNKLYIKPNWLIKENKEKNYTGEKNFEYYLNKSREKLKQNNFIFQSKNNIDLSTLNLIANTQINRINFQNKEEYK